MDESFRVVHEDSHLVVVEKPSGLATTAPDDVTDCLAKRARAWDARSRMHPTSRLDRDVTGLVTFARTDRAIEALLRARKEGTYRRRYVAVVGGIGPIPMEGRWSWPIAIDPRDRRKRIAAEPGKRLERIQEASSRYRVVASFGAFHRLDLFPETGRTHQLRVHCARASHPIAGDVMYGGARRITDSTGRVTAVRRPMLHCAALSLPNIDGPGTLDLESELPDDVQSLLAALAGAR